MTWPVVLFLGLQVFVFGAWLFAALRVVVRLALRAVAANGGRRLPRPAQVAHGAAAWLSDPSEAPLRRMLVSTTTLMIALTAVAALA